LLPTRRATPSQELAAPPLSFLLVILQRAGEPLHGAGSSAGGAAAGPGGGPAAGAQARCAALRRVLRCAALCCAVLRCAVLRCAVEVCSFCCVPCQLLLATTCCSLCLQLAPAPTPLHPMYRQPELDCLLGLADEELQDAWVLLEPQHDLEDPQAAEPPPPPRGGRCAQAAVVLGSQQAGWAGWGE